MSTKKPKAYVGQFTMRFGPATTMGRLLPIRMTPDVPKTHYCTPEGRRVYQVYRDADGAIYERDTLMKGVDEGEEKLRVIDTEALVEATKSDLPDNVLNLTVHQKDDVDQYLFPSASNSYIFDPVIKNPAGKIVEDPTNRKWHDFLNVLVRDSDVIFMGLCNLRNYEGLFKLSMYQGHIVVQKQLYPEDLYQYDPIRAELDAVTRDKALAVARKLAVSFNPDDYRDSARQRIVEVASADFDPSTVSQERATVAADIDLGSALDAFLS